MQAYDTQGGYFSHSSTSPNIGHQSWNFPEENGNAGHPSPSQRSNAYGDGAFTSNGLPAGSQRGSDRYAAGPVQQSGALNGVVEDGFSSREGSSLAANGRTYSNGEHNGDGSGLWGFGSAGIPPESGMWGGTGLPDQRAGRWENARSGQQSGAVDGGGGGGGIAESYSSGGVHGLNSNGSSAELYAMLLQQQSAAAGPHHQPLPPLHVQHVYNGSEQELLARQLAELGLHEDRAAAQAATLQEEGRRQQQQAYLKLLQQQQANLRRQQQQLRQQQQAIASAAATLQHGYGMAGGPQAQLGGVQRREGPPGGPQLQMRPDMPYQRLQVCAHPPFARTATPAGLPASAADQHAGFRLLALSH